MFFVLCLPIPGRSLPAGNLPDTRQHAAIAKGRNAIDIRFVRQFGRTLARPATTNPGQSAFFHATSTTGTAYRRALSNAYDILRSPRHLGPPRCQCPVRYRYQYRRSTFLLDPEESQHA